MATETAYTEIDDTVYTRVTYTITGSADASSELLVDASGLSDSPSDLMIEEIHANLVGFSAKLEWDATANVDIISLPEGQTVWLASGTTNTSAGFINNAGAGKTGDIDYSTTGLGAADYGTITLVMRKRG